MIHRLLLVTAATAAMLASSACLASGAAAISPKPQGAEVTFLSGIQKDLDARFPTPADAIRAGFFRYTDEDDTGAISYANLNWQSSDPQTPSQLWYSVKGKLLGADFSVLQSNSPNAPSLWGINPKRWENFPAHVHYILVGSGGKETYGYTLVRKVVAAGGSASNPTAATLVKLGIARNTAQVKRVFLFPSIWDLTVWVMPNPNGAFADKNPLVTPSANAKTAM